MTELAKVEGQIEPAEPGPEKKKFTIDEIKELAVYLGELSKGLYPLMRAAEGLPPEENPFFGLIDRDNPVETTMLSEHDINRHVAINVASTWFKFLDFTKEIPKIEVPHKKTLDAKNWVLAAALVNKGAGQQTPGQQINLGIPSWTPGTWAPNGGQPQDPNAPAQPVKKKHFWQR